MIQEDIETAIEPTYNRIFHKFNSAQPYSFDTQISPWHINEHNKKKLFSKPSHKQKEIRSPYINDKLPQNQRYKDTYKKKSIHLPHLINSEKLIRQSNQIFGLSYKRGSSQRKAMNLGNLQELGYKKKYILKTEGPELHPESSPLKLNSRKWPDTEKNEKYKFKRVPIYREFNFIRSEIRAKKKFPNKIQVSSIRLNPLNLSSS